ncbi:MAG: hypothetical protein ACLR78_13920 [Roseburia sp.]
MKRSEQSAESEQQSQPAESIGEDDQRERSAQSTRENEPQEQQSEEDTAGGKSDQPCRGADDQRKSRSWRQREALLGGVTIAAHEVALRNRISMQHWEKVAEMAATDQG